MSLIAFGQSAFSFGGDCGLMSSFSKEVKLREKPHHYFASGIAYQALKSIDATGQMRSFKQVNLPLSYVYKIDEQLQLEAGVYLGAHLNKPFRNLFYEVEDTGMDTWRYGLTAGMLLGLHFRLNNENSMLLQYRYDSYSQESSIGHLQVGWSMRF